MKSKNLYFKKLRCKFRGHNYKVSHVVNDRVSEYTCSCCGHQVTTDIFGKVTVLNTHHQYINTALHRLAMRKLEKRYAV